MREIRQSGLTRAEAALTLPLRYSTKINPHSAAGSALPKPKLGSLGKIDPRSAASSSVQPRSVGLLSDPKLASLDLLWARSSILRLTRSQRRRIGISTLPVAVGSGLNEIGFVPKRSHFWLGFHAFPSTLR